MADWVTDLLENLGYNLPSEQDAREDALRPQEEIARETYPELDLQDTPTDLTTLGGNSILKEIVFENSSKESAFQKYINWLINKIKFEYEFLIFFIGKFKLTNKNAFVVGGMGLIGKEIVKSLCDVCANVIIIDIVKDDNPKINY